jgi:hypothetical protein
MSSIAPGPERGLKGDEVGHLPGDWLPRRARSELTLEVAGWCSATAQISAGMVAVGTNAELMTARETALNTSEVSTCPHGTAERETGIEWSHTAHRCA